MIAYSQLTITPYIAYSLEDRRPIGSSGVEVLTERTLHIESCFDFVVRALQTHMPSIQWQSRRED